MEKSSVMETNSLLLLLFLHAMLVPSNLPLTSLILSLLWCCLVVIALPRLFYYIDRLRISREVSAGIVILFGVLFAMMFYLIERAFFYQLESVVGMHLALFVFLSVFIGRIENVYESQSLSFGYKRIFLTVIILSSILLGRYYFVNNLLSVFWQYEWVEWKVWTFWQGASGRLLFTTFMILMWRWLILVIEFLKGERR